MKYTEPGTYKIQYTAEDGCGKTTVADRTVIVEAPPRTVLYSDGTLIINELGEDRARNAQLHGNATNEYPMFDPNGATDVDKYIFANASVVPWNGQLSSILSVEIGSNISPTSTAYWFYQVSGRNGIDLSLLNTSMVTNMNNMFKDCKASTLDLSNFDTSLVTKMSLMFEGCIYLDTLNISSFDTSKVTAMDRMFASCQMLTSLDLSNFDITAINNGKLNQMFSDCRALKTLDLSSFNTSRITEMLSMFQNCTSLETIYASTNFVVNQVYSSNNMFANCQVLKGGAGTVWSSSNPTNKTYAHIDGGTSNPGYFTAKE